MPEIEIKFNPDGSVETPWWSLEIAEMVCSLCGKGGGWSRFGKITPTEIFAENKSKWGKCHLCPTRNPYCG